MPVRFFRTPLTVASLAMWLVSAASPAFAVAGDPGSGCPAPANTLVLTEVMTGDQEQPRWVEVTNPGKYALSLAKVTIQVFAEKGPPVLSLPLGGVLPAIQGGESWALGVVPDGSPLGALLKLKVLDLGEAFVLPLCHGRVVLTGPAGVVDAFEYDLCQGMTKPKPTVLALDPAFDDPCKNDSQKLWCVVPVTSSPYGTPGSKNPGCDLDGDGYLSTAGDCDDLDPKVNLDAPETCNGKDDDCNGQTDDDLSPPPGICPAVGVCASALPGQGGGKPGAVAHCEGAYGFVCDYPTGYEPAKETLCDGFDNNCDGQTDEGLLNACGMCGAPPTETCNGKDDDCNGLTDDGVPVADGDCGKQGVCAWAKSACVGGQPTCVQDLAWQATETTCDGLDNDCDGTTDEMLGDPACKVGIGVCAVDGHKICALDGAVACQAPEPRAPGTEMCGNGLDDNCDGATDEGFDVGAQCESGVGICRLIGKKLCSGDKTGTVCSVAPGKPESVDVCGNGLDDNCNGQTDELGCTQAPAGTALPGCSTGRPALGAGALAALVAACAVLLRRRHTPV